MTHLLQYFPQLSLRPENLPELRSLILQLAVEGKLTAEWRKENPDVEPAAELLSRIAAEKAELVKGKKIKKSKPLPPVSAEEMPFELPNKWAWCHLEETGFTQTGSTPPKKEPSYFGDYIPFLSPAHLSNGEMRYPKDGLSEKGLAKGRLITNGSLLMVCIGGSIGKCNITDRDISCNQQINTLTPVLNSSSYIKIACQASFFQKAVIEKAGGSATPIINKRKWEALPIPLPPLPEQQAIVQTVDALLQELGQLQQRTEARLQLKADYATAALRSLTTAPAVGPAWEALAPHFHTFFDEAGNVQSLRAAILQLAVQGKLTAQWRNAHPDVEPATELLSRIQAEKAELVKAKKIRKEKPLPSVSGEEVPFAVPEGWVWCRLKELGAFSGGGTPSKRISDYWGGDIPWVSPKDMKSDFITTTQDYITEEGVQNSSAKIIPQDSILIVGRSGILARKVPVAINQVKCAVNQDLKVIIPYFKNLTTYLKLFFHGTEDHLLKEYVKYGMTVHSLKYKEFELLPVAIPPLPEQQAIVQAVEELLGLCTALESAAGRRERVLGEWVRAVVAGQ